MGNLSLTSIFKACIGVLLDILTVLFIYYCIRRIVKCRNRNLQSSKTKPAPCNAKSSDGKSSNTKPGTRKPGSKKSRGPKSSNMNPNNVKPSNANSGDGESSDPKFSNTTPSTTEPSTTELNSRKSSDVKLAIKQGYQSDLYPFLESKSPTDTLDHSRGWSNALSSSERELLAWKKKWLDSPYPAQLAEIVAQIIEDRKESPILNVACLGIGSSANTYLDVLQTVMLSQVIAQLAAANPDVLNNIVVQDPDMDPGMRALFINHGFQVVETPAAFLLVGANTFLFSGYVRLETLIKGLKRQPLADVPLFIGNGIDMLHSIDIVGNKYRDPEDGRTLTPLIDEILCNVEDMPCFKPDGVRSRDDQVLYDDPLNQNEWWVGLIGLEIWWKPVRTESEKRQVRFDAARKLGFLHDVEQFGGAYEFGFGSLSNYEQDVVIYTFISAVFHSSTQTFADFFQEFQKGSRREQELYTKEMYRWISIIRDPQCEYRSWQQYLEGWRAID